MKLMKGIFVFALLTVLSCHSKDTIHINVIAENETEPSPERNSLREDNTFATLNFGTTPWDKPEKLRKMFKPLMTYLGDKLKSRIRFVVTRDYKTLKDDVKTGVINIASFTPSAYVEAISEIGDAMTYVASARIKNKDYYFGYIIVNKKSGLKSLKDLKGKKFGFVEKGSSSGYAFPLALLLKRKIDPLVYFQKVFFLGSHSNVTDALLRQTIDAGATWDGHFSSVVSKHPELKILAKTSPIPYDAIVLAKKDSQLLHKLRKILISLNVNTKNKNGRKVIDKTVGFPYSGWVVHSPKIYDIVKETRLTVMKYKGL